MEVLPLPLELPASPALPASETSHPSTREFAKRIREARINAGLTQAQVAARIGVTQAYISKIEKGEGNPTLSQAAHLADAVGCSFSLAMPPKIADEVGNAEFLNRVLAAFELAIAGLSQGAAALRTRSTRRRRS